MIAATNGQQNAAHEGHGGHALEDDARIAESTSRLAATPSLQVAAELLHRLREAKLPWWTPTHLRARFPASTRMRWLEGRPDLRQRITSALTGLAPNAARKKTADFQAELIDAVLEAGDTSVEAFEHAFAPEALVVHGPADAFFREFRAQMPWGQGSPEHQELIAWLLEALLRDRTTLAFAREGHSPTRAPILSAWELRTAIDGKVWHAQMPIEVRVAIDDARLQLERSKPLEPFHAQHDLAIALPSTIAASVPLVDLVGVVLLAEKAMGFSAAANVHVPGDGQTAMNAVGVAAREASTEPFASVADPAEGPGIAGDARVDMPPGSKKTKRTTLMEFPTGASAEAATTASAEVSAASLGNAEFVTGTLPAASVLSARAGAADPTSEPHKPRSERPRRE